MLLVAASFAGAATFEENFSHDPAANGWQIFGDTNLFQWDATNQNVRVTWDSSQTNSYFYRPLRTILAKDDDFSLAFDLRLNDIAVGTTTNKPYTFQLAIGFINFVQATQTNFFRGTGFDSPDIAEFDYFPDSGFGATVSPTIISSNNEFASSFNFPIELATNVLFHIAMSYTASNKALRTIMTSNGAPFGPIEDAVIGTNFSDFRVDTVAVCSYSDAGQEPLFAGSLLAHATVDNLSVAIPSPVMQLSGSFKNDLWEVQFSSRSNWLYTLERTADFTSWTNVSTRVTGNAADLFLQDTNPPLAKAFYRVRAERP